MEEPGKAAAEGGPPAAKPAANPAQEKKKATKPAEGDKPKASGEGGQAAAQDGEQKDLMKMIVQANKKIAASVQQYL